MSDVQRQIQQAIEEYHRLKKAEADYLKLLRVATRLTEQLQQERETVKALRHEMRMQTSAVQDRARKLLNQEPALPPIADRAKREGEWT